MQPMVVLVRPAEEAAFAALNLDAAVNRLGHETANSPIVERASSHVIAMSLDYHW